ncbi:MAG TPA: YMGG-like glycine zipper-containing protein, partial [Pyrinomonadaceae bacterium]|nr:YMGG-like glycine zipper-containing protein [Pyrinomonadaceae bacterium]
TEGVAKGGNQTKTTATRGAIGAGIGAIIGAIAGGGKGAAIGAIIGGGAGAGSVVLTGKEDLELKQGSAISVQSTSPR